MPAASTTYRHFTDEELERALAAALMGARDGIAMLRMAGASVDALELLIELAQRIDRREFSLRSDELEEEVADLKGQVADLEKEIATFETKIENATAALEA